MSISISIPSEPRIIIEFPSSIMTVMFDYHINNGESSNAIGLGRHLEKFNLKDWSVIYKQRDQFGFSFSHLDLQSKIKLKSDLIAEIHGIGLAILTNYVTFTQSGFCISNGMEVYTSCWTYNNPQNIKANIFLITKLATKCDLVHVLDCSITSSGNFLEVV